MRPLYNHSGGKSGWRYIPWNIAWSQQYMNIKWNGMVWVGWFCLKMCWFAWSCLMCNLEQTEYYSNLKQMEVEQPSPYNISSVLQHVDNPNDIMYCHSIDLIVHYSRTQPLLQATHWSCNINGHACKSKMKYVSSGIARVKKWYQLNATSARCLGPNRLVIYIYIYIYSHTHSKHDETWA